MSCARFLLTELNLKLTMKNRQIVPPLRPQCFANDTAINQEPEHYKGTRARRDERQTSVTHTAAIDFPSIGPSLPRAASRWRQ